MQERHVDGLHLIWSHEMCEGPRLNDVALIQMSLQTLPREQKRLACSDLDGVGDPESAQSTQHRSGSGSKALHMAPDITSKVIEAFRIKVVLKSFSIQT